MAKVIRANLRHKPTSRHTVGDLIEERAARDAESTFLIYQEHSVSFAAFNAAANRVAHWAREEGIRRGDIVALAMEGRPEFIICWAGLAKIGAVTALINTNLRGQGLHFALSSSGAHHLVLGEECLPALATLNEEEHALDMQRFMWSDPQADRRHALPLGTHALDPLLAAQPETNPAPEVREGLLGGHDLFYIYTSGTTGFPKATHFSHTRFFASGDAIASVVGYGPEDVIYNALPLYHGAGGAVLPSIALQRGCTMVLRRKFSASQFWDDVRRHGVTGFQYIGEFCRYLYNQPPDPEDRNHRVRAIHGAGLRPEIWEGFQQRFGIPRIIEGYGSTEGNTALMNLDDEPGAVGRIPFKRFHNGRLIRFDLDTNSPVRSADGFCSECGPEEIGEFIGQIRESSDSGYDTFIGYTAKEETQKKIMRNVFEQGDAWFRTGDLFRRSRDDYYYFVDRVGDTYRWKSENVSTQEVAELLSRFPDIDFINVYGVELPGKEGRAGMAALVLAQDTIFDGEAFYDFTSENLPDYAAPIFVRIRPEADVTGTFKLRKIDLQREGFDLTKVTDPIFIRDEEAKAYVPLTENNQPNAPAG